MLSFLATVRGVRRERRARVSHPASRSRYIGAVAGVIAFAAGTGVAAAFDVVRLPGDAVPDQVQEIIPEVIAEGADVSVVVETEQVILEPKSITKEDPYALDGTTSVVTRGKPGAAIVSYDVTYHNGIEVSREQTITVITIDPIDEVIAEGTLKIPKTTKAQRGSNRELGQTMAADWGWTGDEWACLEALWTKESNWNHLAGNPTSGAYGIPQALPASKMKSAGDDYMTNPATQITWGLGYIENRYGTPCKAWAHFLDRNWY